MTVYVVEARRHFEPTVVAVVTAIELRPADGWEFDDLEHRLYGRRRWTRGVPHDSPEAHTVTAWEVADPPLAKALSEVRADDLERRMVEDTGGDAQPVAI